MLPLGPVPVWKPLHYFRALGSALFPSLRPSIFVEISRYSHKRCAFRAVQFAVQVLLYCPVAVKWFVGSFECAGNTGEIRNAARLAGAGQKGVCTTWFATSTERAPPGRCGENGVCTTRLLRVRKKRLPAGAEQNGVCTTWFATSTEKNAKQRVKWAFTIIVILRSNSFFFFVIVGGGPHPSCFIEKPHFFHRTPWV